MSGVRPERRWTIAKEDRARTTELAHALGVPRIAAHLLMVRGLTTIEQADHFLHPAIEHLSDPLSLTDMDAAVARLQAARDHDERVLVFGDYDVDGISGTAIMLNALRCFGIKHCDYAMPSRLVEGYGLGPDHVREANANGVNLIVTVDNGINARDAATAAAWSGLDLVITDHHEIEGDLPQALAVVNPKREEEAHPARDLCGAAVAFKLACALNDTVADLDLVALGTIADIVPLRGENRALAALGLDEMARTPRLGLARLAEAAGVKVEEMTAEKVAFQLGPRINAAGRLGDGATALGLLLTDSDADARRIAAQLNTANDERRRIEKTIFDQAEAELSAVWDPAQRSIVLASRAWHPGVVGIVASRLLERYHRPVVLVAIDEDGVGRGSARCRGAFSMADALGACKRHLIRFGGHPAAAGLAIAEDNIEAFKQAFEEQARKRLADEEPLPALEIDTLVSLSELDPQLLGALDRLKPFGAMNPAPLLCSHAVTVLPNSYRELRGGHVRLALRQGGKVLTAVAFRMADTVTRELCAGPLDVAFTPQFNTWRGETTIQLVLKDVRAA